MASVEIATCNNCFKSMETTGTNLRRTGCSSCGSGGYVCPRCGNRMRVKHVYKPDNTTHQPSAGVRHLAKRRP